MSTSNQQSARLPQAFDIVSSTAKPSTQKEKPLPLTIRLTPTERARLEKQAGDQPLNTFIRECLYGSHVAKRRKRRRPEVNNEQAAAVLTRLGQSQLSSNVNPLVKHANMGTLDVSKDIEQELEGACKAIYAMRDALFIALRLQPPSSKGDRR